MRCKIRKASQSRPLRSALAKVNATAQQATDAAFLQSPALAWCVIRSPRHKNRVAAGAPLRPRSAELMVRSLFLARKLRARLVLQINQRSLLGRCAAPQHPFCLLLTPAVGNRDQGYCGFGGEPGCVLLPSDVAHAGLGPLG